MTIYRGFLVGLVLLITGACDINQPDDQYVGASDPMIELRLASPVPSESTMVEMTSRDGSTLYVADTALVEEGGFETVEVGDNSEGGLTLTIRLDHASAARLGELHAGEHVALLLGSRLIDAVRVVGPPPGINAPDSVPSTITIAVNKLSPESEQELASYVKSHWPRSDRVQNEG